MSGAPNLVLVRHGESEWNVDGRITGWSDVALTATGRSQAMSAGASLAAEGIRLDIVFTSLLRRAQQTAACLAEATTPTSAPVRVIWHLNERHMGQLQGLDREAIKRRWGNEQRRRWRSDPDALPPPLAVDDPRHPRHDPRFAAIPSRLLPAAERITDLSQRVLVAWRDSIAPALAAGDTVAVVAHRDSLRVLISALERIAPHDFHRIVVPPATPRRYLVSSAAAPLSSVP